MHLRRSRTAPRPCLKFGIFTMFRHDFGVRGLACPPKQAEREGRVTAFLVADLSATGTTTKTMNTRVSRASGKPAAGKAVTSHRTPKAFLRLLIHSIPDRDAGDIPKAAEGAQVTTVPATVHCQTSGWGQGSCREVSTQRSDGGDNRVGQHIVAVLGHVAAVFANNF